MIWRLIAGAAAACLTLTGAALASGCPGNPSALGTSRILSIDPLERPKLGLSNYEDTLPLRDHEVVLTFDDGPLPPSTIMILDTLAAECVKATFFVVGEMARAHPNLVQRAYMEGHTIGTHTEHHLHLNRLPAAYAAKEILDGIASVQKVLGGAGFAAPFFRFPYLDDSDTAEAIALKHGLSIWSADVYASDWLLVTPEKVAANAIGRLERRKKGILMLHDIHKRTALALPAILSELKSRGYHIVHVVPAGGDHPQTGRNPDNRQPRINACQVLMARRLVRRGALV
jgi:peptidoglycan/xylan/chitin deacetylase (PgdA/CDA1 family)